MKKMSKGMLMTALICGTVYLAGTPVYASELQEFALDEYVVTAARTETKLVDTPANISVVDAQTIEERHYQDVSEVLKDVPGANVIDTGTGSTAKALYLNGDSRVLVLIDGRRVNIDMGATSGKSTFDLNLMPNIGMIERIEVLKGAGGSLYGSEAVGGVVNIITKKANVNYGKVNVAFGSNDTRNFNAVYSLKENKTGITVAVGKDEQGYYKYKDVASGNTVRWPGSSKYENEKASFKLEQELDANSSITFGYDYSKYEGTSPYDITDSNAAEVDKETNQFYAKYDWKLKDTEAGYIQVYHNDLEYNNYAIGWEGFYKEKTTGIDLQQSIALNDVNKLIVGSSWRETDLNVAGYNNYDKNIDNIAVFVNDTWELAPTWTLNAGIRYDDHSAAGDETTLSAGVNKKINDNSHAYINWGQVFKAPTMDELYYPNAGNPNINPETGDTWTVGYLTEVNDKTIIGMNYFESDLDDAIRFNYSGEGMDGYYENVDKQKKRGMEFTVNHKLNENVDLEASYTYVRVKNLYSYNKIYTKDYNVIPNTYRLGMRYNNSKLCANLFLRAGSGGSSEAYIESSYITVDCAVTYKATENLSIYAKGFNLFNEAYTELGGYNGDSYKYPAQSRRFIVGAEYKF